MGRSKKKKILQQELHIVICKNFCQKKIFVQSIFKALFPQETKLCIQGRSQTRGAILLICNPSRDFYHIRLHTKFF